MSDRSYRLSVYAETVQAPDGTAHHFFGIRMQTDGAETVFPQLAEEESALSGLIEQMNEAELDAMHVADCIEDFVAGQVTV